jgi:hypothetical protein
VTKIIQDQIIQSLDKIMKNQPSHRDWWDGAKYSVNKIFFNNHTLRLTYVGFKVLSKLYQYWACDLPQNWVNMISQGQTLLNLHKNLHMPYYWDDKKFYVFCQSTAFEIQVMGLENWVKIGSDI